MKKVLDSDLKPEMKYEYYVENLPSAEEQMADDGLVYTEVIMHPDDAAARGIESNQIVRVFNDRGQALAGAVVSDVVMRGVIQFPTGAWYDPANLESPAEGLEKHGNPNVLTRDEGTSKLGQGPSAHSALVEVERFDQTPPPVTVRSAPGIIPLGGHGAPE